MNEEQFDTLVRNRGFLDGTVAVKKRLRLHYMQIQHTIAMSPLGNTGEGVLMAQNVGAALAFSSAMFNVLSTSPPKSACPGVSIMFILVSL